MTGTCSSGPPPTDTHLSPGAALYDMLTGRRPFEDPSRAAFPGAALERQPTPVSAVRRDTRDALAHVVDRCLAKDPHARWQHAGDVMQELCYLSEGGSSDEWNGRTDSVS